MIEGSGSRAGSGSGSIPLTNGSGSGSRRPKTCGSGSATLKILPWWRRRAPFWPPHTRPCSHWCCAPVQTPPTMDKISINTPNPKCRLYWCLIVFSLVHLPQPPSPLPCVNKYREGYMFSYSVHRGGGGGVGIRGLRQINTCHIYWSILRKADI
jgi:hypothetical protein